MAVAKAKGKLRGKQPELSTKQQRELMRMYGTGEYTSPTSPKSSPQAVPAPLDHQHGRRTAVDQRADLRRAPGWLRRAHAADSGSRPFPPAVRPTATTRDWPQERIEAELC
ncbi:hypothetical protein GCM10027444_24750 [Actinopolyspora lacussalsi]